MIPDYAWYLEEFQGEDIPSEQFNKYAEKANFTLQRLILNRVVDTTYERAYKLACCELADYYYQLDANGGKELTSESVGNYSANYVAYPFREFELAFQYLAASGLMSSTVCNV